MTLRYAIRHKKRNWEDTFLEKQFEQRATAIFQQNAESLKEIIKEHRWITISSFGEKSASHAFLIVQHADHDREFQEDVLSIMEQHLPLGEVSASDYAYLYDRVRVSQTDDSGMRQLQRYGTQCEWTNDICKPFPVEDPEGLEDRRKEMGLCPMSEYLQAMYNVYTGLPLKRPRRLEV